MEPVREIEGRAIPFGLKNCDTDIIIPAHWLKTISRDGLGKGAFEAIRKDPANVFDDPEYAGAPNGRIRDLPDSRSIRWYSTIGLVDRPLGTRGRNALYGPRHLLQLVAVKRLQAAGRELVDRKRPQCP